MRLVQVIHPAKSYAGLEELTAHAEAILKKLELPYRVISLCSADIGFGSAKTYDLEVWLPGQGEYREISSCSNFEDFQARRMNLRFKSDSGDNLFPHVLNGSGTALARLFVALLETHQQADGSVLIPAPLQPFLKTDRLKA